MAPLILHNVPDDELYIGEDGIRRPYAMVFPKHDASGRTAPSRKIEKGPFGRSMRRSRSKSGTPGAARREENPTIAAADRVFSSWMKVESERGLKPSAVGASKQDGADGQHPEGEKEGRRPSSVDVALKSKAVAQVGELLDVEEDEETEIGGPSAADSGSLRLKKKKKKIRQPIEIILRGYRSPAQQYAAIAHYEALAGRICEDYARTPPAELRRFKSDMSLLTSVSAFGAGASTNRRSLTPEERCKVLHADGGNHWIKVTFESAEAASAALAASPQPVLGYLVFAEPYKGDPPARDAPVLDNGRYEHGHGYSNHDYGECEEEVPQVGGSTLSGNQIHFEDAGSFGARRRRRSSVSRAAFLSETYNNSPASSHTVDSATVTEGSRTLSSGTMNASIVNGANGRRTFVDAMAGSLYSLNNSAKSAHLVGSNKHEDADRCAAIPTARRVKLRPADQALLPRPSALQRLIAATPILCWFLGASGQGGSGVIGNEVPRTEAGDFDWEKASLYWRLVCLLDLYLGIFGKDICGGGCEKED